MKRTIFLLFFFSLLSLAVAGTKEDIDQVQRNVLELQRQFWDLQKDLQANNTAIQEAVKKFQSSGDDVRNSQASINAKMDTILNQIQALNEKLDDTNRRLNELSAGGLRPPQANPPVSGQNPAPPENNPQNLQNPQNTVQPPGDNASGGQMAGTGSVPERQLFQSAMAQYSGGRFEQALRGFQDLLDQYPNSSLADDAQYMIGDSYYAMKEYLDAAIEYDKVVKHFPESPKVPDAKLKRAYSFLSMNKPGQAVIELQEIVQRYPDSEAAKKAKAQLAKLKVD
jgi:tol-pal system protein YbgF